MPRLLGRTARRSRPGRRGVGYPSAPQRAGALRRDEPLERDDVSSSRHPALPLCLSMIFSENWSPLFGIML